MKGGRAGHKMALDEISISLLESYREEIADSFSLPG